MVYLLSSPNFIMPGNVVSNQEGFPTCWRGNQRTVKGYRNKTRPFLLLQNLGTNLHGYFVNKPESEGRDTEQREARMTSA